MIPIPPSIAAFLAKPLVRYGLPVVAIVIAVIAFRWWLADHDRDVRAEYLVELKEQARKESERASADADRAAAADKEKTDEVQNRIANSSSVDDLFGRLREGSGAK